MTPAREERLLVVERGLLERLGVFQGLLFDIDRYLSAFRDPANYRFVARALAERDPSLKQLIPYFIVCCDARLWCYVRGRGSGEERLVAKSSIGIGGHINDRDLDLLEDVYDRAAARELEEELVLPSAYRQRIVALLNDDSDDVGRVHLGIVHVLVTLHPDVRKREGAITEAGFRTLAEIRAARGRLETWSRICVDRIEEILARAPAPPGG